MEVRRLAKENEEIDILSAEELEQSLAIDDPVKAFLAEAREYPLLTADQEKDLARTIKNGDDFARHQAIQKFVEHNILLVASIAKRYGSNEMSLLDLIQEGCLGVMNAAEKFDPDLGFKFSTYATYWIRQAIRRSIDNKAGNIRVPVYRRSELRKYVNFINKYQADNGEAPADEVVQRELGMPADTIAALKELNKLNTTSINQPVGDDATGELGDFLTSSTDSYADIDQEIDQKLLLLSIRERLNNRDYYIIYSRIFASPIKSLEELGKEFGLSRERIRQYEAGALNKIKPMMVNNKDSRNGITKKYTLKQIDLMNLTPLSYIQYVWLYLIKTNQILTDYEYYVVYYLYFDHNKHSINNIAKKLGFPLVDVERTANTALETIEAYMAVEDIELAKTILAAEHNSSRQVMELDISPVSEYEVMEFKQIEAVVSKLSFTELTTYFSDYFNGLSPQEKELLKTYLEPIGEQLKVEDLKVAEREINLHLAGYYRSGFLPEAMLQKTYQANKASFTHEQQAVIEYCIFKTLAKSELDALCAHMSHNNITGIKTLALVKLEKMYFKVDNFFGSLLNQEELSLVLSNPKHAFTDMQRKVLSLYFGVVTKDNPLGMEHSISEVASLLGVGYRQAHSRIFSAHDKALVYHLGKNNKMLIKDGEKYLPYIQNVQYEMTKETREILMQHLIHGLSYEEIAKATGLTVYRISNIITDGIRKMDMFRFGILKPLVFTEEELDEFYKLTRAQYTAIEKEMINARFFMGLTNAQITDKYNIDRISLNHIFMRFMAAFISVKLQGKKLTVLAVKNELLSHASDAILNDREQLFASYLCGIKTQDNPEGEIYDRQTMMQRLNLSGAQYDHYNRNIRIKIEQKKLGFLEAQYGLITHEELSVLLEDPRLPISETEKQLIKDAKGINTPMLSSEDMSLKYGITKHSVFRKFQRAILAIKQYQNGELEPTYDYELDIIPIMRYFSEYECRIIERLYRDKVPTTKLHLEFNIGIDVMLNTINRIKSSVIAILKNDRLAPKYDFAYARTVIHNEDLPIYGNHELLIKVYQMYFGENGYHKMSVPQIIDTLKTDISSTALSNMIYTLILAIEKYKIGIIKTKEFSFEQLQTYYEKYESELSPSYLKKFRHLLKRMSNETWLIRRKSIFPVEISYKLLCEYEELPFKFTKSSEEDAKKLLAEREYPFRAKTKYLLRQYYNISSRSVMNPRDKVKAIKLLGPIYQRIKIKKNHAKENLVFRPKV